MAFPGGKREANDGNIIETAKREASEEVIKRNLLLTVMSTPIIRERLKK